MMSRNVRRLVFDPFPLWQTGLSLFGWLVLGAVTALWAYKVKVASLTMIFAPAALAMSFLQKIRIWQTLPVSRSELGQAQWWYLWGRSFVLACLTTGAAVAIDAGLGALHADWADIGAYLGGQITLLFLAGLMIPASSLARSLSGSGAAGLATIVVVFVTMGLAFHWSLDGSVFAFRSQMAWGGGVSVVLALAAFLMSPWMPLAQPRTWTAGKASKADNAPSPAQKADAKPASAFRVTTFILGRLLRIVPLFALVLGLLAVATMQGALKDIVPVDVWLQFMPFFGGIGAMAITATVSQRVLAGLPLTAVQRTVALHGVAPLLQVPLLALTVAAGVVLQPAGRPSSGLAEGWLMSLGLMSLGAIFLSAIALPMFLRFGQKAPFLFIGVAAAPLGALTGMNMLRAIGAGHALGFAMGLGTLILAIFFAVLVPICWVWTWLELAYGRAAYRQRITVFTTWRGQ